MTGDRRATVASGLDVVDLQETPGVYGGGYLAHHIRGDVSVAFTVDVSVPITYHIQADIDKGFKAREV